MTQQPAEPQPIPEWSLGWRLRRALEWGSVSAKKMATELDVSDGTISRWCHDLGAPPRTIYLRAWASKCQVPYLWLLKGDAAWAAGDSNPQPMGLSQEPSAELTTAELKSQFLKTIRPTRRHSTGRPRIDPVATKVKVNSR